MSHILGMDGGGTRTTAWLADDHGRIVARAEAGPSNPLKVGSEAAERELLRASRLAMKRARVERAQMLDAVCVGLAGIDRPQVHRPLLAWLRKSVPALVHLLTSDAAIALQAAIHDRPGIMVISGTGSIGYGRDERGRVRRSGGWGTLFDDAGSGYDLGRSAIMASLRALDGRGPHTRLEAKICHALRLHDIARVILRPMAPHQIAALFPLVLAAAREGDAVARQLCEEAGHELADIALALLDGFGWRKRAALVACSGGVFASSLRIRRSFVRHLRRYAPRTQVVLLRRPAVEGAIALAQAMALGRVQTEARSGGQRVRRETGISVSIPGDRS